MSRTATPATAAGAELAHDQDRGAELRGDAGDRDRRHAGGGMPEAYFAT